MVVEWSVQESTFGAKESSCEGDIAVSAGEEQEQEESCTWAAEPRAEPCLEVKASNPLVDR